MIKAEVLAWIMRSKIVPVIRASSPELAVKVANSLVAGGIDILEITMTVPGAVYVIHQLTQVLGERALVGAGTVYDPDIAYDCIRAGAKFIVGPCVDIPTIIACRDLGILVAAGALTPTEVASAWRAGSDIVKVFPCDALGGPGYIKSLKAPFPKIHLMPTGGVTLETANEFLKAGAVAVGAGNSLVDPKLIQEGKWDDLTARARAFREVVN